METPIESIVNEIINNPMEVKEIVKKSGYEVYLLSCKLRVILYNNSKVSGIAEDFGLNKWEYVSHYCNALENLKIS